MRDRYLHRFGSGKGFGAEILDMSWGLYQCNRVRIAFALQEDPRPIGVACFQGWNDYFRPSCPTVRVERFGGCNRYYLSRLLGAPQRLVSRKLLDFETQANNYYLFDRSRISKMSTIDSQLNSGQDYDAFFRSIYHYSLATATAINLRLSKLPKVNSDWISLHIRRGDKISEANYVDMDCYVKALGRIEGWRERPILR